MERIGYVLDGREMETQLPSNLTREQIDTQFKHHGVTNWWLKNYPKLKYSKNGEV